jgi:hypothetical protein
LLNRTFWVVELFSVTLPNETLVGVAESWPPAPWIEDEGELFPEQPALTNTRAQTTTNNVNLQPQK